MEPEAASGGPAVDEELVPRWLQAAQSKRIPSLFSCLKAKHRPGSSWEAHCKAAAPLGTFPVLLISRLSTKGGAGGGRRRVGRILLLPTSDVSWQRPRACAWTD